MFVIRRRTRLLAALAAIAAAGIFLGVRAGDLEPPGPPGPTMKPLQMLEPRQPITGGMLPLTITQPGSYYLAETIMTPGAGIEIAASNVSLDLNGFTLAGGAGHGIFASSSISHIRVVNGTVAGWAGDGVHLEGQHVLVDGVTATGNGVDGISLYYVATVVRCNASSNLQNGIRVYGWGYVGDSIATMNGLAGIWLEYDGSVAEHCVASWNQNGIVAYAMSTVRDCLASQNTRNGIRVGNYCKVVGNQCVNNGYNDPVKSGILVTGGDNVVDGNVLEVNNIGLQVDAAGNVIVRNTFLGNTTRDVIAADNDVGPWGTAATATSPWANIYRY